MSRREIARLCFKVLAVYTLIESFTNLAGAMAWFMQMATMGPTGGSLGAQIFALLGAATPVLQVVLGIWLWVKAGVVAAWAVGYDIQDSPEEPEGEAEMAGSGWSADALQAIVYSCLGVWVLIGAIPELFRTIASALYVSTQGGPYADYADQLTVQTTTLVIALLVRLAIGFWLLFGAAGLVRLINRIRGIGLEEAVSKEPDGDSRV